MKLQSDDFFVADVEETYASVSMADKSDAYFRFNVKLGVVTPQQTSLVFQIENNSTETIVRCTSYLAIARNFGALFAFMYVLGSLVAGSGSHSRQDRSLVQRTYQTKLLTDQEMNQMLGVKGGNDV